MHETERCVGENRRMNEDETEQWDQDLVDVEKVFGNRDRTEILRFLSQAGPSSTDAIREALGLSRTTLYRHLTILDEANVLKNDVPVEKRIQGRHYRYSVNEEVLAELTEIQSAYVLGHKLPRRRRPS